MPGSAQTTAVSANGKNADLRNRANIAQYTKFWNNDYTKNTKEDDAKRRGEYEGMVNGYYDGVTDLFEYGWGRGFHFSRFYKGEPFLQAMARHEHYLAAQIGIKANMKVLDVGAGVGGPAREIAVFTDANIIGINNNVFQVDRATKYTAEAGLSHKVTFEKGDFMHMADQFGENVFDAVYAIEATCHAPVCEGVYGEVYKVLKPGAIFGFYEWCMTEKYNKDDPNHQKIRHEIELGDAIAEIRTIQRATEGLKNVGFEILHSEDLAARDDALPWFYPLRGNLADVQTVWDYLTMLRLTRPGRAFTQIALKGMEAIGLVPKGTVVVGESLNIAAEALVVGGAAGVFTPMQLFICRKPLQ
ncbi:hypothetical protein CROQUDRAFT_41177 [Cronartium quercuum f. sp. fusiforme G11]|uniref:SAM-dependent methyltransferase Erg6/SMT-type domain-containing protein n=1 Tax=Cronartium quercuum f. sp. fusiforme G11 TaxID=708437 RepID=A0A9P6TFC2_9BASI|nr:hypothetical protein CROQUDRAFT_41177 [Cronartium quercuum f. sp. fusiforme G11]